MTADQPGRDGEPTQMHGGAVLTDPLADPLGEDLAVVLADEIAHADAGEEQPEDSADRDPSDAARPGDEPEELEEPDEPTVNIATEPWARQYEEFYAAQWAPLVRFVSAVARRRDLAPGGWDAEDIAQLTLLKAALWWTRVDDERRCGWTRTVALNEIRHAQRTEIRQRLYGSRAPRGWSTVATGRSVDRTVLLRLAAEDALAAIADLPDRQAAAAFLRDVDGFTTAEVADILGISPNTARTHLKRGAKALRNRLADWADVAKAIAVAGVCGGAAYLAIRALGRVGAQLPSPTALFDIDPHLRDLLLATLTSLATVYRLHLIDAARAARTWLADRHRLGGNTRPPAPHRGSGDRRTRSGRSRRRRREF